LIVWTWRLPKRTIWSEMPSALSSAFTVISLSTRQSSLKSVFALIFGRASLRVGSAKQATITKFVVLDWSQASLLNLVIRRMISNPPLVRALNIEREKVLSDFNAQRESTKRAAI
jgi:hypothetical protein